MARRKRRVPRYKSLLVGMGLLLAERQARKKVGRRFAQPLGKMGKGLLGRNPGYSSPTGLGVRSAWYLARRRMR
ncbi:MAG TPA: hypothetical protein VH593_31795 [Ktedonobacteraceae bacterium]|jgi:hypothetical protein